ncbi:Uncharacterised protein [Chlamydia abortus]|nr:Uncharacterised protein [Chlamydia abortus]
MVLVYLNRKYVVLNQSYVFVKMQCFCYLYFLRNIYNYILLDQCLYHYLLDQVDIISRHRLNQVKLRFKHAVDHR